MQNPYEWSPICKVCGQRYKLDEEGNLLVQRGGVPIEERAESMSKMETCPLCHKMVSLDMMNLIERMSEK